MDIRERLTELCDAFNAHDLDRIMCLFSDDCALQMPMGKHPWGSRFEGKQNVRAALATRFEGLADVRYGNAQHFVDEASREFQSGPSLELRRTGVEVWGCDFYSFRNGKVTQKGSYWKVVE